MVNNTEAELMALVARSAKVSEESRAILGTLNRTFEIVQKDTAALKKGHQQHSKQLKDNTDGLACASKDILKNAGRLGKETASRIQGQKRHEKLLNEEKTASKLGEAKLAEHEKLLEEEKTARKLGEAKVNKLTAEHDAMKDMMATISRQLFVEPPASSQAESKPPKRSEEDYELGLCDPLMCSVNTIGKLLGKGGFGGVNFATEIISGKEVAIKTVKKEDAWSNDAMVEAELRAGEVDAQNCGCPNVVPLINSYISHNTKFAYFVFELIPGGDNLVSYREQKGNRFSERDTYPMAKQVSSRVTTADACLCSNASCGRTVASHLSVYRA